MQWNMEPAGRFELVHDKHKTVNITKSVMEANRLPSKSPPPPASILRQHKLLDNDFLQGSGFRALRPYQFKERNKMLYAFVYGWPNIHNCIEHVVPFFKLVRA